MTAEEVYADPSALACLHLHQEERTRRIIAWRAKLSGTLAVTHFGRAEITNALCRASFLGSLAEAGLREALADLDADFACGRLDQVQVMWRAALNTAAQLSRDYTPSLGVRSGDVIHVACSLELKLTNFLTFDERQAKLAKAAGLKVVKL